jgi:hypothetical protein
MIVKRRLSSEKLIKDNSNLINIRFFIGFLVDKKLRVEISRRATKTISLVAVFDSFLA